MKHVQSNSQAAQDIFAISFNQFKRGGTFLDIGCYKPVEINNTFILEKHWGWSGLSIDSDLEMKPLWQASGRSGFRQTDALDLDSWLPLLPCKSFDYLSLDIDEAQLEFVRRFPWKEILFRCMTVEHDSYRFGNAVRDEIRGILTGAGYQMAVQDVALNGTAFEDWWIR